MLPRRSALQAASGLLVCGLQQRLLSSIEAFARTLRVHRRTVLRHWETAHADMDIEARTSEDRLDLLSGGLSNDDDRAAEPEDGAGPRGGRSGRRSERCVGGRYNDQC